MINSFKKFLTIFIHPSVLFHFYHRINRRKNHIIRARENLLNKSQIYNRDQTLRNEECSSDEGSRESAEE